MQTARYERLVASISRVGSSCLVEGDLQSFEDIVALSSSPHYEPSRIVYIDASAPLGGDGSSWSMAYQSLHDALNAEPFDNEVVEIRIAGGVYRADRANGVNTLDPDLTYLIPGLVGTGTDLQGLKRVSGGYAGRAFANPDQRDLDLYPTIFTGDLLGDDTPDFGNYADNTKVMFNSGAVDLNGITIEHARIATSSVRWMTDCTVRWCFAAGDDLLLEREDRVPVLAREARLVGNMFHNNKGEAYGGALSADGLVVVANTRFHSNTAPGGGAIGVPHSRFPQMIVQNCFFSGNYADGDIGGIGGAIFQANGNFERLQVVHSTFAGNWAIDGGGYGAVYTGSTVNIRSSIFDQNFSFAGKGAGAAISINSHFDPADNYLQASVFRDFNLNQDLLPPTPLPYIRLNIGGDPGFHSLLGSDNVIGTLDDNPSLATGSISIGQSFPAPAFPGDDSDLALFDLADLDGDCDLTELIPIDIFGNSRMIESEPGEGNHGSTADAGCAEYVPNKDAVQSQKWVFTDPFITDFSTDPIRFFVDADRPAGGDGLSWESAFTSPSSALEIAARRAGPVEIWVAEGEYAPTIQRSGLYSFRLLETVTMYGGFAGYETSADERDWKQHRTVLTGDRLKNDDAFDETTFEDNASMVVTSLWPRGGGVLDGFAVNKGTPRTNYFGPGLFWNSGHGFGQQFSAGLVYLGSGELMIRNCQIETCSPGSRPAVGMCPEDSNLLFHESRIVLEQVDNDPTFGGEPRIINEAISSSTLPLQGMGSLTIDHSEIDLLLPSPLSGRNWMGGRIEMTHTRVNSLDTGSPFAFRLFDSISAFPVIISNCEFLGRSFVVFAYDVHIANCTMQTEYSIVRGSAPSIIERAATIENCVFASEISNMILIDQISITGCVFAEDYDPTYLPTLDSTNTTFDFEGNAADFFLDPLGPDGVPNTGDEDHRLAPGSPAINTGLNALVSSDLDLDGNPRIIGSVVDRGAYEFTGTCTGDVNGDGVIDLIDLNKVLANYGQDAPFGDADGDGSVTMTDLNLVLAAFGQTCSK